MNNPNQTKMKETLAAQFKTIADISSLSDVRLALIKGRDLIDSILTWEDLSSTRRDQLTTASNLIEKAWDKVDAALWTN